VNWKPSSRATRRAAVAAAALATTVSLVAAVTQPAAAMPRPTPPAEHVTQGQVDAARSAKQELAARVGALSGQIAEAQILLQQSQAKAELAEQKYALALSQLQKAEESARRAKAAVKTAADKVVAAHLNFVHYAQATYMGGSIDGTAGTLLTATDPGALLDESALQQYAEQHQADAVGALQAATVAKSNADAKARLAVQARTKAKSAADQQRRAAEAAYVAAQQLQAQLRHQMAVKQNELDAAQSDYVRKTAGRQAWLGYVSRLNTYNQWKARQERLRQERLREQRLRARQHRGNGGGGGGGGGSGPSAPSGGSWSAAKGARAAARAYSQLGWSYAWAGGGAYGPSRGVCDPGNGAPNDCNVIGYDCSGLAMYAWGAGWWAHYAATQYGQAGSYHPGAGNLMPGDLIFWSSNGQVSGIHHVAIYYGGGQIIEAPYSGGVVQMASLYEYGGFFGATRPFT
jgi:peptidoglycan DL-endopeptidase RipA